MEMQSVEMCEGTVSPDEIEVEEKLIRALVKLGCPRDYAWKISPWELSTKEHRAIHNRLRSTSFMGATSGGPDLESALRDELVAEGYIDAAERLREIMEHPKSRTPEIREVREYTTEVQRNASRRVRYTRRKLLKSIERLRVYAQEMIDPAILLEKLGLWVFMIDLERDLVLIDHLIEDCDEDEDLE